MPVKDFIFAVIIMAVWGVNFSIIKLGMASLDSFTLNGLRFLLCAFPLVFFVKKPELAWKYIAAYGLLFGVGVWGMVGLGIHFGASAGIASLIIQLSAFAVIVMGAVIFKEQLHKGHYAGAWFGVGWLVADCQCWRWQCDFIGHGIGYAGGFVP